MNLEFMKEYLVLVVLGICLCVGYILKHLVPTQKINPYIPLIMGVLGVVLNLWLSGWLLSPQVLLGGLTSGLAATGANELAVHVKK
jgi:hypothetical protein